MADVSQWPAQQAANRRSRGSSTPCCHRRPTASRRWGAWSGRPLPTGARRPAADTPSRRLPPRPGCPRAGQQVATSVVRVEGWPAAGSRSAPASSSSENGSCSPTPTSSPASRIPPGSAATTGSSSRRSWCCSTPNATSPCSRRRARSPPLELQPGEVGEIGGVFGFPGWWRSAHRPLRDRPASDRDRSRHLRPNPGQPRRLRAGIGLLEGRRLGRPLVRTRRAVIGMAFAVAPDRDAVAYALTADRDRRRPHRRPHPARRHRALPPVSRLALSPRRWSRVEVVVPGVDRGRAGPRQRGARRSDLATRRGHRRHRPASRDVFSRQSPWSACPPP
jgi:hypothetical protein